MCFSKLSTITHVMFKVCILYKSYEINTRSKTFFFITKNDSYKQERKHNYKINLSPGKIIPFKGIVFLLNMGKIFDLYYLYLMNCM